MTTYYTKVITGTVSGAGTDANVYIILYGKRYNGNDPKINRVLPLPQGNHVAKFDKDPIYRTKVIVRKRSCCKKLYL
jgi:hypothetical protein